MSYGSGGHGSYNILGASSYTISGSFQVGAVIRIFVAGTAYDLIRGTIEYEILTTRAGVGYELQIANTRLRWTVPGPGTYILKDRPSTEFTMPVLQTATVRRLFTDSEYGDHASALAAATAAAALYPIYEPVTAVVTAGDTRTYWTVNRRTVASGPTSVSGNTGTIANAATTPGTPGQPGLVIIRWNPTGALVPLTW